MREEHEYKATANQLTLEIILCSVLAAVSAATSLCMWGRACPMDTPTSNTAKNTCNIKGIATVSEEGHW